MAKNKKVKIKEPVSKQSIIGTLAFIVIFLVLAFLFYQFSPLFSNNDDSVINTVNGVVSRPLKVHYVDVGQGDSIIIELPDGQNMLIDGGPASSSTALIKYIDNLGIKTFNYVIATHSDEDHIGGFPAVFEKYKINYVYRPYIQSTYTTSSVSAADTFSKTFNKGSLSCTTKIYYTFLNSILTEKSNWSYFNKDSDILFELTNESLNSEDKDDNLLFDFISPTSVVDNIKYKNTNGYSPIIMMTYQDIKFMFTGDETTETESEVLDYYTDDLTILDCDVYKVAHHGSLTSNSQDFIDCVKPEYSIICCGDNSYGLPKNDILNILFNSGTNLYRTDLHGSVIFTVENAHLKIETTVDYKGTDLFKGRDIQTTKIGYTYIA